MKFILCCFCSCCYRLPVTGYWLLLFLFCFLSLPGFSAEILRGPYVESVSHEMAVVRFRTDVSTISWLKYGAHPDCDKFMTVSAETSEHVLPLFGLLQDTTHCYRIYLPVENSTNVYKASENVFRTFRKDDKPFLNFIAFGDSGSGSDAQHELAKQMEKFEPDFFLHTGDLIESGLDSDADKQYFMPYKNMIAKYPFFLGLGNHDYGKNFKEEESKDFLRRNYVPFHSFPLNGLPPHYYYFDQGNARFICLDNNSSYEAMWAPPIDKDSKQIKWLEQILSKTKTTWKFVYLHIPAYSTGLHGSMESVREVLSPLFEKYGVDVVFQGHDHNYERTAPLKAGVKSELEGVIYVTLGGGGRPLYFQRGTDEWSKKFLAVHHFAFIEIKEKNLLMKVFDKDGNVIDTLEIQK